MKIRKILYGGVIAAVYAVVSILCAPISYGTVQIRLSEALTVLPAITPIAIWGVFVGCFVANLVTGSVVDIIFGSLTTLVAAYCSYKLRNNKLLVPLPPVLLNGLIVGGYLTAISGGLWYINMLTVTLGQLVSCYLIGIPLMIIVGENKQIYNFFKNS